MKKVVSAFLVMTLFVSFSSAQYSSENSYDKAYLAWDSGDYITALNMFKDILRGSDADMFLEKIALVTGELYKVDEISTDGRNVRFSPDSRYAVYETGGQIDGVTVIVDIQNGIQSAFEINGSNLVFSPTGNKAAFYHVNKTSEIKGEIRSLDLLSQQTPVDRRALSTQQRKITWLMAQNTEIVIYDLTSKSEKRMRTSGLLKTSLSYSADGSKLYFIGGKENEKASNIYSVSENSREPEPVTGGSGFKTNPKVVPGGRYLIYHVAARSPLPQPPTAAQSGRRRGQRAPGKFVLFGLSDNSSREFEGNSPSISADGSTLAYSIRTPEGNEIRTLGLNGDNEPVTVQQTTEALGTPALCSDGSVVTYEMMMNKNYEVFLVNKDGSSQTRLTTEVQHDRFPKFVTDTKILAAKGEGRHRRSYLYDTESHNEIKLFHNNTIRTIAPEYEWAVNPAGTKILIQAERDGDTISPERGIYLLDLTQKVTKNELLKRIDDNLAAETELREKGTWMFRVIKDNVKETVDKISITRAFEYQEKLFKFGSKNITRPGNKPAGDYIYKALKSFGYEPEYQWFEARNVRTANILATLHGTANPELVYVLSSHYDSNARGPGADDNSSGIAVLLETARVLADNPMPATIIFAAFSGEESGLLGSRYFVDQAVESGMKLVAALNNDMIGWCENHRLDNTIRYSNAGIRDVQHASAFLFSGLITYDAHYYKSTDAAAYYDKYGDIVGGIGSYPVLGNPHYHQPSDLLETINHQLIVETSKATTAAMMLLASSPSRLKDINIDKTTKNSIDLSWTPAPEKGVEKYIVMYGPQDDPARNRVNVNRPNIRITGFEYKTGDEIKIRVKAVNGRGMAGWDWAAMSAELGKSGFAKIK